MRRTSSGRGSSCGRRVRRFGSVMFTVWANRSIRPISVGGGVVLSWATKAERMRGGLGLPVYWASGMVGWRWRALLRLGRRLPRGGVQHRAMSSLNCLERRSVLAQSSCASVTARLHLSSCVSRSDFGIAKSHRIFLGRFVAACKGVKEDVSWRTGHPWEEFGAGEDENEDEEENEEGNEEDGVGDETDGTNGSRKETCSDNRDLSPVCCGSCRASVFLGGGGFGMAFAIAEEFFLFDDLDDLRGNTSFP